MTDDAIHEAVQWQVEVLVEKFNEHGELYATIHEPKSPFNNLLMYGGASKMWEALIGTAITAFSNANARIGVGDSSTAEAATQTDLQAVSNKVRRVMDATYPVHVDGVVLGSASIVFKSTFAGGIGTFTWNEWGIFNVAGGGGTMLDRKVVNWGAKGVGDTWTVTVTITLA